MTFLSYKTIFRPTFSVILENLLESFFRNVPKTAILAKNGYFWLCYFFTLIVPELHAKFRKNPWSSFRDQLRDIRTDERMDEGDIIEPVASLVQKSF